MNSRISMPGFYDQEEIIEGCTVQILTNTITGECSVGWWKGGKGMMLSADDHEVHGLEQQNGSSRGG